MCSFLISAVGKQRDHKEEKLFLKQMSTTSNIFLIILFKGIYVTNVVCPHQQMMYVIKLNKISPFMEIVH